MNGHRGRAKKQCVPVRALSLELEHVGAPRIIPMQLGIWIVEVNWLKALRTPSSQLTPSLPSDWLPVVPLGRLHSEKKEDTCKAPWPWRCSDAAFMSDGNTPDLEAFQRNNWSFMKVLADLDNYSHNSSTLKRCTKTLQCQLLMTERKSCVS